MEIPPFFAFARDVSLARSPSLTYSAYHKHNYNGKSLLGCNGMSKGLNFILAFQLCHRFLAMAQTSSPLRSSTVPTLLIKLLDTRINKG